MDDTKQLLNVVGRPSDVSAVQSALLAMEPSVLVRMQGVMLPEVSGVVLDGDEPSGDYRDVQELPAGLVYFVVGIAPELVEGGAGIEVITV